MEKPKDHFLFVATFADGSQIFQNKDDRGTIEGKSCFTDVLNKAEESPLISFVLMDDEHRFGVDLTDGHFEVNGVPFFMHRADRIEKDNFTNFRVVYFRGVTAHLQPGTGESWSEFGYEFGFQATNEKGENVKRTMWIPPIEVIK